MNNVPGYLSRSVVPRLLCSLLSFRHDFVPAPGPETRPRERSRNKGVLVKEIKLGVAGCCLCRSQPSRSSGRVYIMLKMTTGIKLWPGRKGGKTEKALSSQVQVLSILLAIAILRSNNYKVSITGSLGTNLPWGSGRADPGPGVGEGNGAAGGHEQTW